MKILNNQAKGRKKWAQQSLWAAKIMIEINNIYPCLLSTDYWPDGIELVVTGHGIQLGQFELQHLGPFSSLKDFMSFFSQISWDKYADFMTKQTFLLYLFIYTHNTNVI